jgi:Arc-like DNA binding domain
MTKKSKTRPGRGADQFIVRMPAGMRGAFAQLAAKRGRSMNAEVVVALTQHIAFETGETGALEGIIYSEHGLYQVTKRFESGLRYFDEMLFDVRDIDLEAFISDQRGQGFNLTRTEAIRKILREYLDERGFVRQVGFTKKSPPA